MPKKNNKNDPETQKLEDRLVATAPEHVMDLAFRESLRAELRKKVSELKKENDLLTVSEVAKLCRVGVTTVRRWIATGALTAIPLPRSGKYQIFRVRRGVLEERLGLAR